MSDRAKPWLVALLVFTAGCVLDYHFSTAFSLPPDGDIGRGKAAFVTFGCSNCHAVPGADLPRPIVQPPVPVVIGGRIAEAMTDGYFVTAILDPACRLKQQLTRYRKDEITRNGQPRMPHFYDRITPRQLADIVAFLQSRYTAEGLHEYPTKDNSSDRSQQFQIEYRHRSPPAG